MKMYVAVTDDNWFDTLKENHCNEANFWKPSAATNFKAIAPNEMLLFKLHCPKHYIAGGGFFVRYSVLTTDSAWETFGIKNGCKSLAELSESIRTYRERHSGDLSNRDIGCILLNNLFYFDSPIRVPKNFSKNIVRGKTYDTSDEMGKELYAMVQERLQSSKAR